MDKRFYTLALLTGFNFSPIFAVGEGHECLEPKEVGENSETVREEWPSSTDRLAQLENKIILESGVFRTNELKL